jgi:outer membrane receptor protein involved in Fe transport
MNHRATTSLVLVAFLLLAGHLALAQGAYTAQLRGVVTDSSHAVVTGAKITITNDGTNISTTVTTDVNGLYLFGALRPASYTIKAEASGFRTEETKGIVLAVDQQTSLNFTLRPAGNITTVDVTTSVPLLDTENSTLGTDVTNEYVKNIPLYNRSYFGLVFLSGGVTETTGSGSQDTYPAGTNFVSNGQRNATAEIRLDGALISAPEQGEGATTNVYYQPSVEIVQEFKVQNNSFSSEFGNNGGTVVNVVLKSGTNSFHGSGWWFGQRSNFDARDFFNPAPGDKPDHARDQYGVAIGGPIRRNKTFFFFDIEKVREQDGINFTATVPTLAERMGNFANTTNPIYDPLKCAIQPDGTCTRPLVPNQQIPTNEIDAIGQKIINQYPKPTDTTAELNNYRSTALAIAPQWQFDIKVDDELTDKQHLSVRYSHLHSNYTTPTIFGDGDFGPSGDGINGSPLGVHNGSIEHTWTLRPTLLWTNRFAIDRAKQDENSSGLPPFSSVGFPSILGQGNNIQRMPTIQMNGALGQTSLWDQCCLDTNFAHTLYSYSSAMQWVHGKHVVKFGGEQRLFYNNFFQPPYPTGLFNFTDDVTSQIPNSGAAGGTQGNPFASLLFGFPDNSSTISIVPSVANKSKETAFYIQDDWKVTSRLTLNLGLRYEWSTPYSERDNHVQFSDFSGDSGIHLDLSSGDPALRALGLGPKEILGTTIFATPSNRSVPVDRNNFAPRIGFAFQLTPETVVRGGAGIYYGLSVATNFQYPGTAFQRSLNIFFTDNNFTQRTATLENPFPTGLQGPEGTQYGKLAEWGFINQNDLGTQTAQNADIYQWNLGVQRLLPSQIVVAADYSANRSTHLPWGGYSSTRNRNYISSTLLASLVQQLNPSHDPNSTAVTDLLNTSVNNPFAPLFSGPNAIFSEPQSRYGASQLPLVNLLRPYPQFDSNFEGLPLLEASSWYQSLQIRFQKHTTHYVSFEGNYTLSKSTDDSSIGANAFVGYLNNANPQQLDRLDQEHAISANDATHRLVGAVILDIPVGRERWIGQNMNRVADAFLGGWALSTVFTLQTGQPIAVYMANSRLQDGNQRPNALCANANTGISAHRAALSWENPQPLAVLNAGCFADPGDQIPGDAPRYFSNLRGDGAHNMDLSLYKEFVPHEGMTIEVRAEAFNFTNSPRFAPPNSLYAPGNTLFGTINQSSPGYNPRHMQFGARFQF